MRFAPGARLGPYEVIVSLGAGGMGEVYRARDTRLGRDVAIKVLPDAIAADPDPAAGSDRLARFEREARAVAALNHPHILTIYDVGTDGGTPYVVTELLEGETWRDVLTHRTPSPRQVLTFAQQAAQGLAAAHVKGLAHRDLKPENLFLTTDGRVKILDFGLAKQVAPGESARDAATMSGATRPNVLVGTLAYMSPEQVQAHAVDVRSDVFSLGVVLYEMLAREHPFRRETVAATLAAILQDTPPPLARGDVTIPTGTDAILRRCLAKRREDRFADARELAQALDEVLHTPGGATTLQDVEERSPYPGLRSFTEQDAAVFFGRDEEVAALWQRIRVRPLLALIGPSGAGKTSFIRAGVIPARPDGWATIVCTPGTAPLRALGQALAPELTTDLDALRQLVAFDDPDVAVALLSRWRRGHDDALVVFDQFEELFTLNAPEVQAQVASLIGRLITEAHLRVVLSLRDDFLMRCHDHPALAPVFADLTPLGAITRANLRRAVVEPARKRGYRFEDEALVDEMVECVEGARAALPLLAFAVAQLWELRDREQKVLTRAAYEQIGGVAGALAQHAEATLDRVGSMQQDLVRELFRNLVTAQGTRAVMDRDELLSAIPDRAAAEAVLGELVDARLITSYEVEGKPGGPSRHRIEIAHESLLKAWPRLVRWQMQDEEGAQLRDQLKQAAHLWDEKGRTADLLWTGTAFQEYALWRQRYPGALTAVEEEFARSMADKAQRWKRRVMTAVASVIVALAATAIAIGISRHQATRARDQARAEAGQREAAQLFAIGRLRLADSPNAALAYAIASLERSDNGPARRFAVEALWQGPPALFVKDAGKLAWSPDGRWLALGRRFLEFMDRRDNERRRLGPFESGVLEFSLDSRRLVSAGSAAPSRALLRVWALPEGKLERTLEQANASFQLFANDRWLTFEAEANASETDTPSVVRRFALDGTPPEVLGRFEPRRLMGGGLAIDPSGTWMVSAQGGRLVQQWLDRLSAPSRLFGALDGPIRRLLAQPWTNRVVTSHAGGEVRIWDVPSDRLERTLKSPADAGRVGLDPTGRFLATCPSPPAVATPPALFLFDLAAPRTAEPVPLLGSEEGFFSQLRFSPDGTWLASTFASDAALWNLTGGHQTVIDRRKAAVVSLAFAPDGDLLSGSADGTLRRWSLSPTAAEAVRDVWTRTGPLFMGAVDPGGRFVATFSMMQGAVSLVPFDKSPPRVYEPKLPAGGPAWASLDGDGLDRSGRFLAVMVISTADRDDPEMWRLRVVDLSTNEERTIHVRPTADDGCQGVPDGKPGVKASVWLRDGRLVTDGYAGLRVWDHQAGTSVRLRPCWQMDPGRGMMLLATPDARTIVRLDSWGAQQSVSSLSAFDVVSRATREITSHGNAIEAAVLDSRGAVLVTGDNNGLVRAGRVTGEEPHLLFGHTGSVKSVAVSPDGRWIASGGEDGTIRLWPMPDLSKPPLHTLPHDELLAKLRSLTNLRAVRDPASDTGWKVEIGPFPGWAVVPTWQP